MKEVLLVSDMVGVGKVALSAMIPILSVMDVNLSYLPTAMVSNNFGYGRAEIQDMTESMEKNLKIWKDLNFNFDIVTTGIVISKRQVDLVRDYINWQDKKPYVIVDPIMGDNGNIYPGLNPEIVVAMKEIVPVSDLLIPNATEAGLILDRKYTKGEMTEEIIRTWIEDLRKMGAKSIAITSVKIGNEHFVYGYEDKKGFLKVKYEHVPITFGGTGDIFSSIVTGEISKDKSLEDAIKSATEILSKIIAIESKKEDKKLMEISIPDYLHMF